MIFIVIAIALFILSFFMNINQNHFLQLNGYKNIKHLDWLRTNPSKMYAFPQKNSKKKLVWTSRVVRLFITESLISLLVTALNIYMQSKTGIESLAFLLLYLLIPCFSMLANLINSPIEKMVKQYYINDAKKIIRSHKNLLVIGITGSYGKTSMKHYLTEILTEKYNVLMTPQSYNTPMGVTKTIREQLSPSHEIFVCEMGAKNVGEIKAVCDIVSPQIGIITSIGPQHLESFKSIENVVKTKLELADALPNDSTIFLNGDDEKLCDVDLKMKKTYYGTKSNSEIVAGNIKIVEDKLTFDIGDDSFQTNLLGVQSVLNLTGAIAVAKSLDVPMNKTISAVKRIKSVAHRLEPKKNGEVLIVDDAFNSNPIGAKYALDAIKLFENKIKIVITPGFIELGEEQEKRNYEFGKQIADTADLLIITNARNGESIVKGAESNGLEEIEIIDDVAEAVTFAYNYLQGKEKVVLLENDLPDNY